MRVWITVIILTYLIIIIYYYNFLNFDSKIFDDKI
jgi:hypothetical protein